MSSSLKTINILSQQKVESLVSSGAQKAIKETGQGGEGLAEYNETDGEWGGFRRKSLFPHVSTPLWYHLAEPYVPFCHLKCYLFENHYYIPLLLVVYLCGLLACPLW